jgi:hypothetical protein
MEKEPEKALLAWIILALLHPLEVWVHQRKPASPPDSSTHIQQGERR